MKTLIKNQKTKRSADHSTKNLWEELLETVQDTSNQMNGKNHQANLKKTEYLLNMAYNDLLNKFTLLSR